MSDYRQLSAWQRAHGLTVAVYRTTRKFPRQERTGLSDQARCAALKLVCSIAQGFSAESPKEQRRYYRVARGSSFALDALLLLSRDLGYLKPADWVILESDCRQLTSMLRDLIASAGPP